MSMVTSCPACTTTFRVTAEQLKQREGKVRCGKCSGVFDAFKSLATLPDAEPAEAPDGGAEADAAVAVPEVRAAQDERPPAQGALDIGPAAVDTGAPAAVASTGTRRSTRRWPWVAGAVVLGIALALQLVYAFRDQVAAAWPGTRPVLERVCARIGCVVAFPRRAEQLAIESSDLLADPKQANVVVLTASLRNRGSSVVAHPALELTLTNAQDQAIARRVFQPADYLKDPAAADRGLAGMSEIDLRIALDTGDLKPAGYRLFLFYP